eukprot:bmy_10158T0
MQRCIVKVDLRFPPSMPAGAQELISKLLKHNPSERLLLAQVSAHPWVRAHPRRVLFPSALQYRTATRTQSQGHRRSAVTTSAKAGRPFNGFPALAPSPAPRQPTSGVRGRSRRLALRAPGGQAALQASARRTLGSSATSPTPSVFSPRPSQYLTLRWVRRPPAPPDWSVISYAPVTSRSLWISSRRHLRELTGRWKEMARTEVGPSRSKSSNANGQGPRWACGPEKPDIVPETVHLPGPLSRRNREGSRSSPLTFQCRRRHFGGWQIDEKCIVNFFKGKKAYDTTLFLELKSHKQNKNKHKGAFCGWKSLEELWPFDASFNQPNPLVWLEDPQLQRKSCQGFLTPVPPPIQNHCGTWAKEVLITFLKRYFSKIWCFTDHSQCCQFYRCPTSAFQIAASEDSSTCIPKAEDPAVWKGTIRVSKPEVKSHYPHVGQGQRD